jgi:hypothetical protein
MATEDLLANTHVLEAELLTRNAELNELRKLRVKYEQVPQLDITYLNKEYAELCSDNHKVGMSINPKARTILATRMAPCTGEVSLEG